MFRRAAGSGRAAAVSRRLRLAAAALSFATAVAGAATPQRPRAQPIEALVERVIDGDSLRVAPRDGTPPFELRLAGIDAPELCQDGGTEAREFLAGLVLGRAVFVVVPPGRAGRDDFGRTLGAVLFDGTEVNRRLVEEGHAFSMRYKWDRGPYIAQERMARSLRRGLHRGPGTPELPREFRKRHGPCR